MSTNINLREPNLDKWFQTHHQKLNHWVPAVNVYENDQAYRIEANLPGIGKDQIQIQYEDKILKISGQSLKKEENQSVQTWREERPQGEFERQFKFQREIDVSQIHASYIDGVLATTLPKSEVAKATTIQIQN